MARVVIDDNEERKPGRGKVVRVEVKNLNRTKSGWKTSYHKVLTFPGWEEFKEKYGEEY